VTGFQRLSRFFAAIAHLQRAPEVLRCIRDFPAWPSVVAAYLGLRELELPIRVSTHAGMTFGFEEFYDLETMWQIYCRGVYDVRRSDRLIIDAGANIGLFACYAATMAPHSIVHAVEPMPPTYDRLVRTVRENGLQPRVQCHNYALGSRSGAAAMAVASASQMAHVTTTACADATLVVTATFAQLVEKIGSPVIDLLKMDIEGSEYDVLLSTSPDVLRFFRRITVEFHMPSHDNAFDKRVVARHLTAAGFTLREDPNTAADYCLFHFTR
jgi:FkbM family methyltransferase